MRSSDFSERFNELKELPAVAVRARLKLALKKLYGKTTKFTPVKPGLAYTTAALEHDLEVIRYFRSFPTKEVSHVEEKSDPSEQEQGEAGNATVYSPEAR